MTTCVNGAGVLIFARCYRNYLKARIAISSPISPQLLKKNMTRLHIARTDIFRDRGLSGSTEQLLSATPRVGIIASTSQPQFQLAPRLETWQLGGTLPTDCLVVAELGNAGREPHATSVADQEHGAAQSSGTVFSVSSMRKSPLASNAALPVECSTKGAVGSQISVAKTL